MERSISGFRQDAAGDWVAELECGHRQHVRHRPPWENRPWVVTEEGRRERAGKRLSCGACAQALAALSPRTRELVMSLDLLPHPEGGYYRETYRASLALDVPGPQRSRSASTAIYFLIPRGSFSAFHRILSDEVWHHYDGAPLEVICLSKTGKSVLRLGPDFARGERPQGVVFGGTWFASRVDASADSATHDYALVGCTVAPGFDFADFEMAEREALCREFPEDRADIEALTR